MEDKELDYESISTAMSGFLACCFVLKCPFTLKGGFTQYRHNMQHSTVIVMSKSFTAIGTDSFQKCIKDACMYLIKNFSALEEFRIELDKKEKENAKYCEPINIEESWKIVHSKQVTK